ncbi:MAG: hypothetical protein V2A79_13115 [Planctomycetota bacterium]
MGLPPARRDLGGQGQAGPLPQRDQVFLHLLGHPRVGELLGDLHADLEGVEPALLAHGELELHPQLHELLLEHAAGRILQLAGLFPGEVRVQFFEDVNAAIEIVAAEGLVPGSQEFILPFLATLRELLRQASDPSFVGQRLAEPLDLPFGLHPIVFGKQLLDVDGGLGHLLAHGLGPGGDHFLGQTLGLLEVPELGLHLLGEMESRFPLLPADVVVDGLAEGVALLFPMSDVLGDVGKLHALRDFRQPGLVFGQGLLNVPQFVVLPGGIGFDLDQDEHQRSGGVRERRHCGAAQEKPRALQIGQPPDAQPHEKQPGHDRQIGHHAD